MKRHGYTLVEVMIASALLIVILGGVGSLLIGVVGMTKRSFAEAELSLAMREMREKLLFHVVPAHDGKVWAGLLSCADGVENGIKVYSKSNVEEYSKGEYHIDGVHGLNITNGIPCEQTVQLVIDMQYKSFMNDGDRYGGEGTKRWLMPSALGMIDGVEALDYSRQDDKNIYFIKLSAEVKDVSREERIAVPLFGINQEKNEGNVFHD